jgi:ATP-dependent helicase HrpA
VSGRTYPVEIRYRGPDDSDEDDVDALAALRELDREPDGDVLVFLPGEAEIRDAMDAVRGMYAKDARPTEVLPSTGASPPPSSTACSSRRPSRASAAA